MRHKKRFTVSDTVTYRRTWYVWAYTEDEALETAENEGPTRTTPPPTTPKNRSTTPLRGVGGAPR